jgi:hypothetical protein
LPIGLRLKWPSSAAPHSISYLYAVGFDLDVGNSERVVDQHDVQFAVPSVVPQTDVGNDDPTIVELIPKHLDHAPFCLILEP